MSKLIKYKRKERQIRALERQALRSTRTSKEQSALLAQRPGEAKREQKRLSK